jgi:PAS domain S-box-containing protein
MSLRPNAPDWLSMVVANAVLAFAAILQLEGAREFRGLSPRSWQVYAGGVVTIGILAFFLYVVPNLNARAAVMSAFLAVVLLRGSITLLRAIPPMYRFGLRLNGALFGLCGATHVVRAVYCVFGPPLSNFFALSGVIGALFLAIAVQVALFPVCFILLADERAISTLKDAKEQALSLQESLRESERKLREALKVGRIGYLDWNLMTNEIQWSPETYQLFGHVLGGAFSPTIETTVDMVPAEDRAFVAERLEAVIRGTAPYDIVHRMVRTDGQVIYVHALGEVIRDKSGTPLRMLGTVVDVTESIQIEEALRERERRLRLALDASAGGSWTWDAGTNHIDWDDRFRTIYGFSKTESASFDSWLGRVHEQDRPQVLELLDEIRNKKTSDGWDNTFRIRRPDGTISWIQSLGRADHDAEGQVTRLTGLELNVTDRKLAEEALRAADRRKNEFLATLAHELRNPLAALSMGLELARGRSQLEPTMKQRLDMMDRHLSHLVRLVDDLLDVGRISAGKIQLQLEPVTLPEVVANSMEEVRAMIESRRHEVVVQIQPGQHRVRGDSARLTQVIANLIENAAKYTEPGGQINVSILQEDGAEVVRVKDNGIGIPGDELPRVFDLFSQVSVHQEKSRQGLGIGLAIVHKLAELHGGSVGALSAGIGHGSTFTLRLPTLEEATSRPAPAALSNRELKRILPHRRILIVDDNDDAAVLLAEFLKIEGHQTWIANDGLKAIELAKANAFDVVFMDIGLPEIDGIETARRIRALPGCDRLRIAALTGWGQDSDRTRTRQAGFDWHLVKPVKPELIKELVATLQPLRDAQIGNLSLGAG